MFRKLLRLPLYCLAALVALVAALVFFGVSDHPENMPEWKITQADIGRAKIILHEGSKTRPDEVGTIELSLADMNLVGNYLLNRFRPGKVVIALKDHKIRFAVTAKLPDNAIGKYVNISFRLGHEDNSRLPVLTKFKAGRLLLPSKAAAFVIDKIIRHTSLNQYFLLATDPIKAVNIADDKISITYHPSRATLDNAREILSHDGLEPAFDHVYRQELAKIIKEHDPNWRLSLAELLQPLFALALERSTPETAISENRIVINLINSYVNSGKSTATGIDKYYPAFLYKRVDLAQHFVGAAAITASVDSQIAQVLGEEKELQDSRGGSGFSFVDLAADRAGMKFGEMATANPESARQLQLKMSRIKDYTEFMPDPRALPENMDEQTFKQRYGKVNSEAYLKVSQQIDQAIASTKIFSSNND